MSANAHDRPHEGDRDVFADPTEYERSVAALLAAMEPAAAGLCVSHQETIKAADGSYVIDAVARFRLMGVDFVVLVECKLHRTRVKRKDVQVLHDKIRSVGAHKGIMVSSAGFQRGGIEFALAHGIALISWNGGPRPLHNKINGSRAQSLIPSGRIGATCGRRRPSIVRRSSSARRVVARV